MPTTPATAIGAGQVWRLLQALEQGAPVYESGLEPTIAWFRKALSS